MRGCCYFGASYTHQGFVPSHGIFRHSKFNLPGLCILQAASSCCWRGSAVCTAHWAEQPQEVTGVWHNCPCFPFPLPCSVVHCTPLLHVELSLKSLLWAGCSALRQIPVAMVPQIQRRHHGMKRRQQGVRHSPRGSTEPQWGSLATPNANLCLVQKAPKKGLKFEQTHVNQWHLFHSDKPR